MKSMRTLTGLSQRILAALAFGSVLAMPVANAQVDTPREQRHRINLDDVELTDLIEDVSILTGYTFIVHPQVRGRVTVTSQTPLTTQEVFDVFLSTLRVHQFVAVPAGDRTYRIVPEATASATASIPTMGVNGESFVTQILRLNYFSAVEAAQMINPVLNPSGQVIANRNSNTLVVVDYASNMSRIREIVRQLDEDQSTVQTLALQNVPAGEMETLLNGLSDDFSMNFTAVASDSTNAVVIRGEEISVARALQVARDLDATERVRDNIRVLPLSNQKAEDIVPVLERLSASIAEQAGAGEGSGIAPTISYHEATNSLIVSADHDVLNQLERVVAALDVRRPQVLVEALVVEMSDSAVNELGLQFLVSGTDGTIPFASTNYSRSAPNLLALTGALASDGGLTGDSSNSFQTSAISSLLGLEGLTLGAGGTSGDTLFGIILNAVENDVHSNILSTPMLMAVDNETSSILVGQEIPITTGQVLDDASNAFTTIERENVGVQLDVTPQIGEGDTVRLAIYQEASNVADAVSTSGEFITNQRSITTTVIADDGELIVLGGLIEQTTAVSQAQVPVLGDLPGIGRLFQSRGVTNTRTNLMVFIRPTIVRDSTDLQMTTAQRYRYLRAQEILQGEEGSSGLDQFLNEVLSATPPDQP
ncbi:type II secretion system secretin GspD [Ponticaulis sp.]|uniref:type II secretion system secretin GspD n=1 Tax=Ponticaulis sp. TaxID=2020902 RepID=UPI0025F6F470|nr:type II secretion system secretin GspD [Ponticaulis sp.]